MGVLHAQLSGPLIHELHKTILTATYVFCRGDGGIVAGSDTHTFDEVAQTDLFSFLQQDGGATITCGVFADGDHVIQSSAAIVDRFVG